MPNAWFRFYSETLRDRKLERIARVTGHPKAVLIGIWVTLLALANDSPERGILLLTDDIPLVFDDLCLETGMDAETMGHILKRFIAMEMLSFEDGIYFVTNWGKRQFKSDSSAERVKRYRERQSDKNGRDSNDAVTLQEQQGNAPESESDTESKEDLGADAPIPATLPEWQAGYIGAGNKAGWVGLMCTTLYQAYYANHKPNYGFIAKLCKKHDPDYMLSLIWQTAARPPAGDPLRFVAGILSKKLPTKGPAPPPQRTITTGGTA